jgi:hypothetical protein
MMRHFLLSDQTVNERVQAAAYEAGLGNLTMGGDRRDSDARRLSVRKRLKYSVVCADLVESLHDVSHMELPSDELVAPRIEAAVGFEQRQPVHFGVRPFGDHHPEAPRRCSKSRPHTLGELMSTPFTSHIHNISMLRTEEAG